MTGAEFIELERFIGDRLDKRIDRLEQEAPRGELPPIELQTWRRVRDNFHELLDVYQRKFRRTA